MAQKIKGEKMRQKPWNIPAKTESGECEASEGGEEVPGGE